MPLTGALLTRGMLAGLLASLLCFAFLRLAGEPAVDRAIAFESHHATHDHPGHDHATEPEEELVSRPVQSGIGLFTGVGIYGAALGGLFALTFAALHGRAGPLRPRATAALLAAAAFTCLHLVPALKYPANPPAIGDADTIGWRTALFFTALLLSLLAMIGAATLRRRLLPNLGAWNASLAAAAAYLAAMAAMALLLPGIDEIPPGFPAATLWQFRLASLGSQLLLWAAIGLLFGPMAERVLAERPAVRHLHPV